MSNITLFKYLVVFAVLAEALSFLSFQYPQSGAWLFGVAAIAAVVLTVRKLECGVMLVFGELVIGSFGRMLEISLGGFDVSIRMVLWLVVMAVWLAHAIQKRRIEFLHSKLFKPYAALAVILGWGIVWGIIRGNPLGLVFSDANNYLYFTLMFPVYDVLSSSDALRRVGTVIAAAMTYVAAKTVVLFYIFSHEFFGLQDVLYDWSRYAHLAEITNIDPTVILSRIFMQSQVWLVFGFFAALGVLYTSLRGAQATKQSYQRDEDGRTEDIPKHNVKIASAPKRRLAMTIGMLVLSLSAIIASFSRSFWLAMAVTFIVLVVALLFVMRERLKAIGRCIAITAGTGVLSVGLVVIAMQFPIPPSNADADVIKNRAGKFAGEAAVSSRYAQIRPLFESIKTHPVFGSGFGTSVTYESLDPRVLKNHPDGKYTTTAFELGWLDMWLKIGLLGIGAYLYLLWRILKLSWHIASREKNYLVLGALVGLVAVALTHGVSPYLNHPLGIGVVMLVTGLVDQKENRH